MVTQPQPVALLALLHEGTRGTELLLGRKLRGFGQGNIVLPGGKIDPGESAQHAAMREFREETGVCVQSADLTFAARVTFTFPANPRANMDCAVFTARIASGMPVPSEELEPLWFPVGELPVRQMWEDSPLWLPALAAGERFTAKIILAADNLAVQSIDFEPWG
ncbi:8-oxo-dGTP diphosphatase [Glutamicibacter sp. AOP38-B1-38]|uniref:8-oxo-dGTP diphosphatase n=1 Tax=Glutamicibacter sp. AOP38-B1-38 TaxID=3457680 RepID=UPI0040349217